MEYLVTIYVLVCFTDAIGGMITGPCVDTSITVKPLESHEPPYSNAACQETIAANEELLFKLPLEWFRSMYPGHVGDATPLRIKWLCEYFEAGKKT
jgi:hypothetical protein